MEIELPSGKHVTLRDGFLRGDRRAALRALKLHVNADGSRNMDGSLAENVTGAILRSMIVGWDVGQPLPRDMQTDEQAQNVLDQLDDDDYDVLAEAIRKWRDKVLPGAGAGEGPATCPHCGGSLRPPGAGEESPNLPSGSSGTSTSAEPDGQQTLTT